MEAGSTCVSELPTLPAADQSRIVRHYARQLPDYINPAEIDALVSRLDPDISLPLAAYAARYSAIGPGEERSRQVADIVRRADQRGDTLARAHIEFVVAARIFRRGGDSAAMERHLERAFAYAVAADAVGLFPYITNSLAVRAKIDGEYDLAITRYRAALKQFELIGDLGSTGIAYANIANIFSDLGDNQQATEMNRRAIEIYREHSPEQEQRLATAYTNLGTTYSAEQKHDEAIAAFEQARRYSDRLDTRRLDGLINYQNALALFAMGNRSEAIEMAEQSINETLEHRDPSEAATALNWLAARYLENEELIATQQALDRARAIMEPDQQGADGLLANPGNTYWAQEYAQSMGSLLVALGRKSEASEYFDVALQLSNERFEREKLSAVVNSELLFEVRDRDLRLQLMEDNATIAELELRQSRLQLLVAIAAALVIAMVGLVLYRSYREQKREAKAKHVFFNEIHHRTKNNLQLLSSVLNLEARRADNKEGGPGSRESAANRARLMALVHDHIYADEALNSTMLDLHEFIDDLMVLLEGSLGREDIALTWRVDCNRLDVNELTPLGLLISELVTNAYKHGFTDSGGTVNVLLESHKAGFRLVVEDDGCGFSGDPMVRKSGSLGLTLVDDLVEQLDATCDVETGRDGTRWIIVSRAKS
ncbi:tetratricopeptide repeat protein [Erythrobacter ani]|uniref:histidine kinase n=1 Tax=Erythrobacter ani TaxID=2827235 RepID=A0ABS6SNX4_9SPHN|nr:tetratricopeptide repeat protein [Erythrobacter ani]MBV7266541.1 tetratricopeptide repeat protein [Erythrobacter ani]